MHKNGKAVWMFLTALAVSTTAFCDLKKGDVAPEFSLATATGSLVSLKLSKIGNQTRLKVGLTSSPNKKVQKQLNFKLLLLTFSTTWCPGCQMLREILTKLWKRYSQKGLLIIAVYDDDPRAVKSFAKVHNIPYIIAIDDKSKVTMKYKVEAYPTVYFVGVDGKIVDVPEDYSEAYLAKFIESFGIK
jgi:peroxiredoxin